VRSRLVDAAVAVGDPTLRVMDASVVHLTLIFIGEVAPGAVPGIVQTMERAASGLPGFDLAPEAIAPLPDSGRPRLVAAVADCPPPLAELQRRLAQRLASPKDRRRPYRPHLTVGRWSDATAPRPAPPMPPLPDGCGFPVREIALVRSRLRPEGATHEVIATVGLSPVPEPSPPALDSPS
jgi:2'-5' RNA ligase